MTSVSIVSDYLPEYASNGSSGVDLKSRVDDWIAPGSVKVVPTGIRVGVPDGWELQIRPRSGLAVKHQITVLNTPGTIDSDYTGEVGVVLKNHHPHHFFEIKRGDRIAQAVLCPVGRILWEPVEELCETTRGSGGFGSSGVT